MGRTSAFLLRLCIMASAIVMLVLSLRAVRAEEVSQPRPAQPVPDPGPVYGYNPGEGLPHDYIAPPRPEQSVMPQSVMPQPVMTQPVLPQPGPPQSRQAGYGYRPGDGGSAPQPLPAQAAAPAPDSAPRRNPDYRLGPGDKVRVTVYGETDLSGEYQLDGAGVVRLPLIGALRASGDTAPVLEGAIATALSPAYLKSPRVNVEIITYRPFYIIGAVGRPGEYPYVDHISALNAVALAGGFLETAKQSTVYVRHEGSTAEEDMPIDQVSELRPGDTIRVKTTLFWQAMQIFTPLTPAVYAAAAVH
jgi:polysaccharide export outer membrane protein